MTILPYLNLTHIISLELSVIDELSVICQRCIVTGVGSETLICDSPHRPENSRDSNYQLLNLFIDG